MHSLYVESSEGGSEGGSSDALAAIELMFATPDTPEYAALTDVLVRYIAVRDEITEDSDSDSSDSD